MEVDGKSARSLFHMTKDITHVNFGSYGLAPDELLQLRQEILTEIEAEPDMWFRYNLSRRFDEAADLLADLYNAPRPQVTIVPNATVGVSSVLSSLELGPEDVLLVTSFTYGAVRMQCDDLARRRGVRVRVLEVALPFSHDSVVAQYEAALSGMQREVAGRRLALVDHITSVGGLLMPVERILALCRRFEALSLVDGAHAPGQLMPSEMDLGRLQPDFYTGNLHKWAFVPRSCALLYVAPAFLDAVRPEVISWLHASSFRKRFAFRGSYDGSNVACVPAALRFAERLGGLAAIRAYVGGVVRAGARLVAARLGTELLCAEEFSAPFMVAVYLGPGFDAHRALMEAICSNKFGTIAYFFLREVAGAGGQFQAINGRYLLRISAQVVSTADDFRRLADGLVRARERLASMSLEYVERLPSADWGVEPTPGASARAVRATEAADP